MERHDRHERIAADHLPIVTKSQGGRRSGGGCKPARRQATDTAEAEVVTVRSRDTREIAARGARTPTGALGQRERDRDARASNAVVAIAVSQLEGDEYHTAIGVGIWRPQHAANRCGGGELHGHG